VSSPRTRIELADLDGVDADHRIVIGVGGADGAAALAHDLIRLGVARGDLRVDDPDDVAVVGRGRQRDEADAGTVSVGAVGNQEHLVPGFAYAVAGFIVGFAIGALVGPLFSFGDVPVVGRSALVGLCGGLALSTAAFVFGLSRGPELAGQGRDAPATSVLSVRVGAARGHREVVRRIGADPVTSWWLAPGDDSRHHRSGTARHPGDRPGRAATDRPTVGERPQAG
jgi:hypothetical protein